MKLNYLKFIQFTIGLFLINIDIGFSQNQYTYQNFDFAPTSHFGGEFSNLNMLNIEVTRDSVFNGHTWLIYEAESTIRLSGQIETKILGLKRSTSDSLYFIDVNGIELSLMKPSKLSLFDTMLTRRSDGFNEKYLVIEKGVKTNPDSTNTSYVELIRFSQYYNTVTSPYRYFYWGGTDGLTTFYYDSLEAFSTGLVFRDPKSRNYSYLNCGLDYLNNSDTVKYEFYEFIIDGCQKYGSSILTHTNEASLKAQTPLHWVVRNKIYFKDEISEARVTDLSGRTIGIYSKADPYIEISNTGYYFISLKTQNHEPKIHANTVFIH